MKEYAKQQISTSKAAATIASQSYSGNVWAVDFVGTNADFNSDCAVDITSFTVGNGFVGGNNYGYVGKIDDFRVYDYAMSDDEVLYIANGGSTMILVPLDSPAELYEDDIINGKDFALFALQWLGSCE